MKKMTTLHAIVAGIALATASIAANAGGYDPMGANRYSAETAPVPAIQPTCATQHTGNEGEGFRPFAAHRYTASGMVRSEGAIETAMVGNTAGFGFRPFAADRYQR